MQIDYQLAESVVTVAGTRDVGVDIEGKEKVTLDATVTVGVRGEMTWARQLRLGSGAADDDFSATLTPDGRLAGIAYKSTGVGAKVVGATVTVAAAVAGMAARTAGGPAIGTRSIEPPAPEPWAVRYPDLAGLRKRYRALVARTSEQLVTAREAAVDDPIGGFYETRRLDRLLTDARAELARLDALREAWNAARRVTHSEQHTYEVPLPALAEQDGDTPPDPETLDERNHAIWSTLGVIVTVGPASGRRERLVPRHVPAIGSNELAIIRWRIPRPVRIWTWHPDVAGDPVLHSSVPTWVVDEHCDTAGIELDARLFGNTSVQLEFGPLGAPSRIARGDTSAAGTIADVITAAPGQFNAGLTAVNTVGTTLGGLQNAAAERDLAGLKRQLDRSRTELELAGIGATAEQYAELKRLEQLVALGKARADA